MSRHDRMTLSRLSLEILFIGENPFIQDQLDSEWNEQRAWIYRVLRIRPRLRRTFGKAKSLRAAQHALEIRRGREAFGEFVQSRARVTAVIAPANLNRSLFDSTRGQIEFNQGGYFTRSHVG